LRAAARFAARQAIELRVKAARGEFLPALDLLAPFPPMAFLGGARNRLRSGFRLGDLTPFAFFRGI
jgi:hypothetical protein